VAQFERQASRIVPAECRAGVLRFDVERFGREFFELAMHEWAAFQSGKSGRRGASLQAA
jgi:hypothetical protein